MTALTHRKRILAVDDDESNLHLMENLIEFFGYEPELAKNGSEAMSKMQDQIDLVILDIIMPGIDGFTVARQIRQDHRFSHIPILVVTILSSQEDQIRATEAGADAFISKPFHKWELRDRVETLLSKARVGNHNHM